MWAFRLLRGVARFEPWLRPCRRVVRSFSVVLYYTTGEQTLSAVASGIIDRTVLGTHEVTFALDKKISHASGRYQHVTQTRLWVDGSIAASDRQNRSHVTSVSRIGKEASESRESQAICTSTAASRLQSFIVSPSRRCRSLYVRAVWLVCDSPTRQLRSQLPREHRPPPFTAQQQRKMWSRRRQPTSPAHEPPSCVNLAQPG